MPSYSHENAVYVAVAALFFWHIVGLVLNVCMFRRHKNGFEKANRWCDIMHAFYSLTLALFCLVYADGKPGTTWLHDNFYKLQMFDVQKYA